MYFDGHERDDVVKECCTFLRRLVEIVFLHPDQAPTPEAAIAFPSDVPLASTETREKTVFFFNDESTFNSNKDQSTQWGKRVDTCSDLRAKGQAMLSKSVVPSLED